MRIRKTAYAVLVCLWMVAMILCISCYESDNQSATITYEECLSYPPEIALVAGCNDLYCTPGMTRCLGNAVQQCIGTSPQYSTWVTSQTCIQGCSLGACVNSSQTNPNQQDPNQQNPNQQNPNQQNPGQQNPGQQTSCTVGKKECWGKTLKECKLNSSGQPYLENLQTCTAYCNADYGVCTENLPPCKLVNNTKVTILQWTDGDTLWVRAINDGTCNHYEFDSEDQKWKQIRYDIRIHGIDAPECSKARNSYYYYECTQNSNYNSDNEHYGYEAWVFAKNLLPMNTVVTVTCDKTESDGQCEYDRTDRRFLAYLGYEKDNASYDFSIEIAREGLAFSNIKFASKKRTEICNAQKEAINANKNIWSLGSSVSNVINQFPSKSGLSRMESVCRYK